MNDFVKTQIKKISLKNEQQLKRYLSDLYMANINIEDKAHLIQICHQRLNRRNDVLVVASEIEGFNEND